MARSVKPQTGIKGMDIVLSNLQRELRKIENRSLVGLIESAAYIRRDMNTTSPIVPIDWGDLNASWFTFPGKVAGKPVLLMGFDANYALYVHEMVDAKVNW